MPATAERVTAVMPFGIEADAPQNSNVMVQSIPGCTLRGALAAGKPGIPQPNGQPGVPVDGVTFIAALPPVPGQRLHVNPAKLMWVVTDPLYDDNDLCHQIENGLAARRVGGQKVIGAAPQKGTLDAHRMKTLVREMVQLVETGYARVVEGVLPKMEDVDELPGKYLLNPGARMGFLQPMYEQDYQGWIDNLQRIGG